MRGSESITRQFFLLTICGGTLSVQQAINSWWEGFRSWQIPWQKYDVLLSMQSNAQMLNGINLGALYKAGCNVGSLGVIACLLLVE